MRDEDEINTDIQRTLGRVEGQLSRNSIILQDLRSDIIRHFEDDKQAFRDLSTRIGGVEKKFWWFSGVGAVVAFIATKLTGKF